MSNNSVKSPSDKSRPARCHCGKLEVTCTGEPNVIVMCHCEDCQRRTSSAFNLGAWFDKDKVKICGTTKAYTRVEHDGIDTTYHFCPDCGTSMYWDMPLNKEIMAVAVGAFADPQFPHPTVSFYENQRHTWVAVPEAIGRYIGSGRGEKLKS